MKYSVEIALGDIGHANVNSFVVIGQKPIGYCFKNIIKEKKNTKKQTE